MASDSDDELPPLESDSAVGYTAPPVTQQPQRSSLLRPEPSEGKKSPPPVQPARRPRDPQPQLWQAPDLTCRSTVRGVKRGKPKPREPSTLVAKDRCACGYASAPDEPSTGKEQRHLALEAPSLPETPQDSDEECFSPKRLREPDELDKPQESDEERPRPRSSHARSAVRALDRVLVPKPALDEATQLQREGVMAKRREDHLRRWPTRRQARLVDTVQELREHFSGAVRLAALRTRLREEMAVRDMGIGDMFALVDTDQSSSLDASELHDMARRLSCAAQLQDAERLVAERGADGELTIEAFVEWFPRCVTARWRGGHTIPNAGSTKGRTRSWRCRRSGEETRRRPRPARGGRRKCTGRTVWPSSKSGARRPWMRTPPGPWTSTSTPRRTASCCRWTRAYLMWTCGGAWRTFGAWRTRTGAASWSTRSILNSR